jgi:hypothetical protein
MAKNQSSVNIIKTKHAQKSHILSFPFLPLLERITSKQYPPQVLFKCVHVRKKCRKSCAINTNYQFYTKPMTEIKLFTLNNANKPYKETLKLGKRGC